MKQAQALSVMMEGNSVFLTGPPGSGKTFVLNNYVRQAVKSGRVVAVTASTGIAATHIGGTTIHSWSGLGIREQLDDRDLKQLAKNDRLIKRYNGTDVLVIDEVSMLHGRRLDMINEVCKLLRKDDSPFGGLQVILVGDLFQLPPVSRQTNDLDFAHLSTAWAELNPKICYLSEQHRLRADGLLDLLESMRLNQLEERHKVLLKERLEAQPSDEHEITRLYAHNVDIDRLNQAKLDALDDEAQVFEMQTHGGAVKVEQLSRSVLAPEVLELKVGAEVMFVANNSSAGFVNGTRGQVARFEDGDPVVELHSGRSITVEPHSWKLEEDGKVRAEVMQLPLRLAWAITIHKSQGMSLDAAEIDLSRSFTPGMGYVALSRVRSSDGLYLSGINGMALRLNPQIYDLDKNLRQSSADLAAITKDYVLPKKSASDELPIDLELLAKLKSWRQLRATRDKVPAYIVAHDSALEQIASRPPQTQQALLGLKGFGPKKLAAYGDEILALTKKT